LSSKVKAAAISGIIAPIFFALMVLIEVSVVPGYNQLSQQISDLGAYVLYGSYSALQNLNFWVSGILIAAFAIGLRKALPVLRAVTWPLGVSGVMIFLSGVFQDQPFPWPGSAHALDLTGLQSPDISFWTIWDDETLLGVGALKRLSADHGEVKSMYTVQSLRRRGAGSAMLRHIIATARASGMSRQ